VNCLPIYAFISQPIQIKISWHSRESQRPLKISLGFF